MMRYPGLVLFLVGLAAIGFPQAAPAQQQKDAETASQTNAGKTGAPDKKRSRKSQKPVTTFKPSEKIRADSAVSFPVDI